MIKLRSSRGSVKMAIGGILAGLAGIYFAVLSFQSYTEKSWPQATATVDSVSVDEHVPAAACRLNEPIPHLGVVPLDRAYREDRGLGNLAVIQPSGEEAQDLVLTRRQRGNGIV